MSLFLKFAVAVILVALIMAGLVHVLSALFVAVSEEPPGRLKDPGDEDPNYHGHEGLPVGRE